MMGNLTKESLDIEDIRKHFVLVVREKKGIIYSNTIKNFHFAGVARSVILQIRYVRQI